MEILDLQQLRAAKEPTIRRVQEQAEGCHNPNIARMLRHISIHLLSTDLNVNRLKEACGIRDNSVAIHFHAAIGAPPHKFISEARIEIAKRLLTSSDWKVFRISDALGFSSIQVFSRAFARSADVRPTVFRKQSRRKKGAATQPLPIDDAELLKRLVAGQGTSDEVLRCIVHLIDASQDASRPHAFGVISLIAMDSMRQRAG